MSGLMGLLLELEPDKREQLAQYWGLSAEETTTAVLYGEMVDAWSVALVREGLPAVGRLVLDTAVSAHSSGIALSTLATALPLREEELRAAVAELKARGLLSLHQEADREVVQLPDELRRVLGELGRQAARSEVLPQTVERALNQLPLAELQRLAARWGIGQPETRLRREIEAELAQRLGIRDSARHAVLRLSPGARRVLTLLVRKGGKMVATAICRQAQMDERGLRAAARELAEMFVVRQSFAGGERALVAPIGLGGIDDLPVHRGSVSLHQVPGPPLERPGFRAVWDLLSLLAYLRYADPPVSRVPLNATHQKRLAATLLCPDGESEARRLAFLLSLAQGLALVGAIEGSLRPTAKALHWEQMDFAAQTASAYGWWLQTERWQEGLPQSERRPGGPLALRAGRERLAGRLRELEPGRWYRVDSFLAALREQEPLLFRDREQVLLATGQTGLERLARNWERWDGRLAHAALTTSLRWLGVVQTNSDERGLAFTLTPLGAWLLGREDSQPPSFPAGPSLAARSFAEILVTWPDAPTIAALTRFAEPVAEAEDAVYRISAESVRRAVAQGLSPGHLFELLTRQGIISNDLRRAVEEWASRVKRVRVSRVLLLEAERPDALAALLDSACGTELRLRRLSCTAAVVGNEQALARDMGRLRRDGFTFSPGALDNR